MRYGPPPPRPEYVKCIAHDHASLKNESWCGRFVGMEFHFQGADHAAESGRQNGRLVACTECVAAIYTALQNGATTQKETA